MTSPFYKSALELAELMRSGRLCPLELMKSTFKRIRDVNPLINAFVALREALQATF